ncbi:MAG: Uncharacterized protein G01um101418_556 [Parcubacteria group bacterium Gr01-1014_18]|nr:MAG: Uncharacterized protein Greene041636_602 [Parcubacteria group bacterium Greene0416_36]TSC80939.1 MAG: Uncharacterized protein G01um101418_556 [Parcubacteria group bacterium Gr01-1014_18]TSD06470.1 MAG: Uncharacterized protein Greene07142_900 [Parcubacteria group bacterium Greene0714_2]
MNEKGMSIMLSVLVIMSVSLLIALSIGILGSAELEVASSSVLSENAFHIADLCAEEAATKLRANSSYTGESITFSEGSCTITVTGAGTKTIDSVGVLGDFTRKVRVIGTIAANSQGNAKKFSITSWEEIP